MIGFVLGTGEGRAILSHVNKYTDEIVVSTATEYGYEIYKEFKAKHFNYRPLNEDEFKDLITKFGIDTFVDASHPYACEVSKTLIKVCNDLNIEYIRYERKSYFNDLKDNENIIFIDKYEYLEELFKNIDIINSQHGIVMASYKRVDLWLGDEYFSLRSDYNDKEQSIIKEDENGKTNYILQ